MAVVASISSAFVAVTPAPVSAATAGATADNCSWYGHNNAHVNTGNNLFTWTSIADVGGGYDGDCTGYVEVKCHTNGTVYTLASSSFYVQRNCIDTNFKKTDHNARADSGVLWGFPLYEGP